MRDFDADIVKNIEQTQAESNPRHTQPIRGIPMMIDLEQIPDGIPYF